MPLNELHHSAKSVVVVGGGVIGAFVAYHLARRGRQVTIIEKDGFGRGSSWGNCGIILPSHLFPLNSMENLLRGLRWMMKKDAPLYIRPRFDPALAAWFTGFVRRCTHAVRHKSARANAAMLGGAADEYERLIEKESIRCEWQRSGAIQLYLTAEAALARAAENAEARQYGEGCKPISPARLKRLEPTAASSATTAWMDEQAAHLRPDSLMAELRRVLTHLGVSILENTPFLRFRSQNGRAVAAATGEGDVPADAFVAAVGAWTPLLADALGVRLPIQPGKGYSVTLSGAERLISRPCFFEEARSVATPWPSGLRLGGTMEFSGFDDRINRVRIDALFSAARRYLGVQDLGRIEEEWCGWRPMTIDGAPIIDRLPALDNVVVAAGHNMLGIAMAPATGCLVAEMLTGEAPHIDPAPYRLARFGRLVK